MGKESDIDLVMFLDPRTESATDGPHKWDAAGEGIRSWLGRTEPGREGLNLRPLSVPTVTRRVGAAAAGVVLLAGLLPATPPAAEKKKKSSGKNHQQRRGRH